MSTVPTNVYNQGDMVRVTAAFVDDDGDAADPTTVTARHKDPSGNVATLVYGSDAALIRDSAGVFHVDIAADEGGFWWYGWYGAGAVVAADENTFFVKASQF